MKMPRSDSETLSLLPSLPSSLSLFVPFFLSLSLLFLSSSLSRPDTPAVCSRGVWGGPLPSPGLGFFISEDKGRRNVRGATPGWKGQTPWSLVWSCDWVYIFPGFRVNDEMCLSGHSSMFKLLR